MIAAPPPGLSRSDTESATQSRERRRVALVCKELRNELTSDLKSILHGMVYSQMESLKSELRDVSCKIDQLLGTMPNVGNLDGATMPTLAWCSFVPVAEVENGQRLGARQPEPESSPLKAVDGSRDQNSAEHRDDTFPTCGEDVIPKCLHFDIGDSVDSETQTLLSLPPTGFSNEVSSDTLCEEMNRLALQVQASLDAFQESAAAFCDPISGEGKIYPASRLSETGEWEQACDGDDDSIVLGVISESGSFTFIRTWKDEPVSTLCEAFFELSCIGDDLDVSLERNGLLINVLSEDTFRDLGFADHDVFHCIRNRGLTAKQAGEDKPTGPDVNMQTDENTRAWTEPMPSKREKQRQRRAAKRAASHDCH